MIAPYNLLNGPSHKKQQLTASYHQHHANGPLKLPGATKLDTPVTATSMLSTKMSGVSCMTGISKIAKTAM